MVSQLIMTLLEVVVVLRLSGGPVGAETGTNLISLGPRMPRHSAGGISVSGITVMNSVGGSN